MLIRGFEVPDWRRSTHQVQLGRCPSGVSIGTETKTECCKKESSKADANQQCTCKFYTEQAKGNVSNIQANHPEYLTGLSNNIPSVVDGKCFY